MLFRSYVGEVLVRKQYIPKFLLFKALAERHAMPFVDLSHVFIDARAVERVPKSVAVKFAFIPIELQNDTLVLGVSDPFGALPAAEIAELAGVTGVKTVLCTPGAVASAIDLNYGAQGAETGVPS